MDGLLRIHGLGRCGQRGGGASGCPFTTFSLGEGPAAGALSFLNFMATSYESAGVGARLSDQAWEPAQSTRSSAVIVFTIESSGTSHSAARSQP